MKLDIAVALKRHHKKWSNKKISWSDLVAKLSTTQRTNETLREYMAASKKLQDDIKDVGGFVGGYLNDGVRSKSSVRHRQLITLDIDDGKMNLDALMDLLRERIEYEFFVYTTHKHTFDRPRVRIVMPLDRPVSPDEYEAISRWVAGEVNIDIFDPTTFQPSRLMYWPSTSSDGDYFTEHEDFAEVCCADDVLGKYVDWKDITAWPRLSTEEVHLVHESKKAGDPREKDGLVGAWCRAYSVPEVIETFLGNVYEEANNGRYTYLDGSSGGGGVVYNQDLFFYSHHSTDPAGQKLVNAFDLVRIHKFGGLDIDPTKPVNKLESFSAMCKLAMNDTLTKKELRSVDRPMSKALYTDFAEDLEEEDDWMGGELPEDVDDIFSDTPELVDDGSPEFFWPEPIQNLGDITAENWEEHIEYTKKGEVIPTISNLKLIILFDPDIKGRMSFNEFDNCIYVKGPLPWDASTTPRLWEDKDEDGLMEVIETKYGIYNEGKTVRAIGLVALINRHHPIRTFLNGVQWDGVPRLDRLLIDHMGAEDSVYVRNATRKAFVAAVARVMKPGCKWDYVLTLVGDEGLRKSALLNEMGGAWFSDSFTTVDGTKAYEQLQGSWLIEIAELAAFNRSETNAIKSFITKKKDKYRPAYHRVTLDLPRQCAFFATTNDFEHLKGHTGNRRFWPIEVTKKFQSNAVTSRASNGAEQVIGLPVNQLWAEAVHYFRQGERLYLTEEVEVAAKEKQEAFSEQHSWQSDIEEYLERPIPVGWDDMSKFERRDFYANPENYREHELEKREFVCARAIAEEYLGIPTKDLTTGKLKEIGAIMSKQPGWVRRDSKRYFSGYGSTRFYERRQHTTWLKNT